jgi:ribosomal protein L19E
MDDCDDEFEQVEKECQKMASSEGIDESFPDDSDKNKETCEKKKSETEVQSVQDEDVKDPATKRILQLDKLVNSIKAWQEELKESSQELEKAKLSSWVRDGARQALEQEQKAWNLYIDALERTLKNFNRPKTIVIEEEKTTQKKCLSDDLQVSLARQLSNRLASVNSVNSVNTAETTESIKRLLSDAYLYFNENKAWITKYSKDKSIPRLGLVTNTQKFAELCLKQSSLKEETGVWQLALDLFTLTKLYE